MTTNPRVVITGGMGTLATAIAETLRSQGWEVSSPGRTDLDVLSDDQVNRFFSSKETDLLICNAGITRDASIAHLDPADWDAVWQVNYAGALRCIRAVLPEMQARKTGHIILISSHTAIHPPAGVAAYATAKAALIGLLDDLAPSCGAHGIRINAILPGFMESRMTSKVSTDRRVKVLASHVLGRLNTTSSVAGFIRFLHEELPHTSGQVFQLDSRIR